MNRRIRDPYVRWCERCTPSALAGGAAYSIRGRYFQLSMNFMGNARDSRTEI
jgi:hypothetical protein